MVFLKDQLSYFRAQDVFFFVVKGGKSCCNIQPALVVKFIVQTEERILDGGHDIVIRSP